MPNPNQVEWEDYSHAAKMTPNEREAWLKEFDSVEGGAVQVVRSGDSMMVMTKFKNGKVFFDCQIRRIGTMKK